MRAGRVDVVSHRARADRDIRVCTGASLTRSCSALRLRFRRHCGWTHRRRARSCAHRTAPAPPVLTSQRTAASGRMYRRRSVPLRWVGRARLVGRALLQPSQPPPLPLRRLPLAPLPPVLFTFVCFFSFFLLIFFTFLARFCVFFQVSFVFRCVAGAPSIFQISVHFSIFFGLFRNYFLAKRSFCTI
jgi:hypothetical protein